MRFLAPGVLLLLLISGCVRDTSSGPGGPGSRAAESQVAFGLTLVDAARAGFEPSLAVGPDGVIYVCSPRGLTAGTNLYRSVDGGASFEFVGEEVHPWAPPIRTRTADLGGGDCDVAVDAAGRAYLADLWGGSVSVETSSDRGATWNGVPVTQVGPFVDRPWLLGGRANEVWMLDHEATDVFDPRVPALPVGGVYVLHSTDGGRTFLEKTLVVSDSERPRFYSSLTTTGDLLAFVFEREVYQGEAGRNASILTLAASRDGGRSWALSPIVEQAIEPSICFPTFIFPSLAADARGGLYAAWTFNNTETGRYDLFFTRSLDGGEHWAPPILLADRPGTRVVPWIAAGASGMVGVAWYETNVTLQYTAAGPASCDWTGAGRDEAAWRVRFAVADGRAERVAFRDVVVDPAPVHVGDFGRPYAEVLQVRSDPAGRAAIAYVADRPEGTARPMFALQEDGPLLH